MAPRQFFRNILWTIYAISLFGSFWMVIYPIIRGQQSLWWLAEYDVVYQKWGFWNAVLVSYYYLIFYSAVLLLILAGRRWYKAKDYWPATDSFYSEIPREHVSLYQHYFTKIIHSIDVNTETKWARREDFDIDKFQKNARSMERIILHEAAKEGLNAAILQVMVNQYIFADVYEREMDQNTWVKRVTQREEVD